jgi:hypothetical protein
MPLTDTKSKLASAHCCTSPEFDRHGLDSLLRLSEARNGFNSLQTICNVACAVACLSTHETFQAIDAEFFTISTVVCWRGPCRQPQTNLDDIGLQFISS